MILFISNSGECLPIAFRMQEEGTDVKVYLHSRAYADNYAGLVPKAELQQVRRLADEAEMIIFDITRINEGTVPDRALLKSFGLPQNSPSVFGPVADHLRGGRPVIGAAAWADRLEFDREQGERLARQTGLLMPKSHRFKTATQARAFLKSNGRTTRWVLKPLNNADLDLTYVEKYPGELRRKLAADLAGRLEGDFMLQERIEEGAEVSTEAWWNGDRWLHRNHTLESKRLMSGDLGMSVGSQINCVWLEDDPLFKNIFDQLAPVVKASGYIGPVDINCMVRNGRAWFLEFTPRFGYDALYGLLSLIEGRITDFFTNNFEAVFRDDFACCQRISIPPYPYEDETLLGTFAVGVPVNVNPAEMWLLDVLLADDRMQCAGGDGIIGVVTETGQKSIESVFARLNQRCAELEIGAYLQYRSDGPEYMQERYEKIQQEK